MSNVGVWSLLLGTGCENNLFQRINLSRLRWFYHVLHMASTGFLYPILKEMDVCKEASCVE